MRRLFVAVLFSVVAMAASAAAQDIQTWVSGVSADAGPAPMKSLDLSALDRSVNPCENFYQFACGGWRKNNPLPGDKARYGRFDELQESNRYVLKGILERASDPKHKRSKIEAQVGDFYAACMDEKTIEERGARPVQPYLERIAAVKDKAGIVKLMGEFRREGLSSLFGFGVGSDLKDSNKTLINMNQGGTTLPDRDNYLKPDPKSVETREKYVAHMVKMFQLVGESASQADADAKTVLAIETKLADAQLDRIRMRDPNNRDHKMSYDEMTKLTPSFDFNAYFAAADSPKFTELNVGWPDFFKALDKTWTDASVDNMKTYLRWRVLRNVAPALSSGFEKESFDFFSGYLRGIKEMPVRWKRCVGATDNNLGEALGQLYVEKTFGAEGKARMAKMITALSGALEKDINQLDWMGPETKQKAVDKLHLINKTKIGYPDKYRDYSAIVVKRDDYFGNNERADAFEVKRNYDKFGKPVDKTEWGMSPPTVNAYYNPQFAEIVFPAGILQPPFFSREIDDAVNFGAIGAVIGHEMTHGFDDSGRKFDGQGNLKDWWTADDAKKFEERAACVDKQYSGYSPVKDPKTGEPVYLKGKLTMGENLGDNGGVRVAFAALEDVLTPAERKKLIDGFTPEQRFFLGFGQVWCQNSTEADSLQRIGTDPHSAGEFRANGTISNMEAFEKAFSCKAGQPMAPEKRCRVW